MTPAAIVVVVAAAAAMFAAAVAMPSCNLFGDVVMMIPYLYDAEMYAWGTDIMAAGAAMELWRFDGTTTRHRVRHAPAIHPNPTYPNVTEVIWHGTDAGRNYNNTFKILLSLSTALGRHPDKDWFIKTDTDSFVNARVLRKILSEHPSPREKKWYMGWRVPDRGPNGEQPCVGSIYIISRKLMEESTAALAALADRYCWGCEEFYWEDTLVGNEFLRCCGTKATPLNSLIAIYDTLNPTPNMLVIHHRKDPNKMRELKPIMHGSVAC